MVRVSSYAFGPIAFLTASASFSEAVIIGCQMPAKFAHGVVPMAKHRLGNGQKACVAGSVLCYNCQCRVECEEGYIAVGSYGAVRPVTTTYFCQYAGLISPPISCIPITDRKCQLPAVFGAHIEGHTNRNALKRKRTK